MKKVVYVTFGSGSGDLFIAASIFNAFKRKNINFSFTAISSCAHQELFSQWFTNIQIKAEPEKLFRDDLETELYQAIVAENPDILIVNGIWVPMLPLLDNLNCFTIMLLRKVPERWLSLDLGSHQIHLEADYFDLAVSMEPNFHLPGFQNLEPFLIRNRNEILTRDKARNALSIEKEAFLLVSAQNGYPGELEIIKTEAEAKYSDKEVVHLALSNDTENSLFPLADYMNGIDFLFGGCGYNLFYESLYFNLEAKLFPFTRNGDDQFWRLETNREYQFDKNGADQLIALL